MGSPPDPLYICAVNHEPPPGTSENDRLLCAFYTEPGRCIRCGLALFQVSDALAAGVRRVLSLPGDEVDDG